LHRIFTAVFLILTLSVFVGDAYSVSDPIQPRSFSIRYQGSPAIAKFIEIANNVYGKSTFTSNVLTKSKGGEGCVFNGSCDIGGVADELKPDISEKGGKAVLIGKDAVAVIIHQDNPVETLSVAQLRGIFSGKIKNWKDVGGFDEPIQPLITSPISATHQLFKRIVMEDADFKAKVMEPDPTILLLVSSNRGAIGFTSFFLIDKPRGVKAVRPDGKEASVANPEYPLLRPLYLITKEHPRDDVQQFLDWAVSEEGQSYLKLYFIGIK